MFVGEWEGLGMRLCIHAIKLFKYFKSNLHQNKLVLIIVEKKVICNVHFNSETKFKIQHTKEIVIIKKRRCKCTCAWRK